MQTLDSLEIRINRSFPPWTLSSGLLVAEIHINKQPLIEIVREIEEPFIRSELEMRRSRGENISELELTAGDYLYLPPSMILLPSRNLLDSPCDCGFVLQSTDPKGDKAIILGCTCGVLECWFLQVRITLFDSIVEWRDFCQFHREWEYNLEPFYFDYQQYEFALRPLHDRASHKIPISP